MAQLPEKDELSWSKMQLTARMDVAMGGRVAEEIVFGSDNITSGKEEIVWGRREGEVRRGGRDRGGGRNEKGRGKGGAGEGRVRQFTLYHLLPVARVAGLGSGCKNNPFHVWKWAILTVSNCTVAQVVYCCGHTVYM